MNYAYWLANVPGIGNAKKHRLSAQAGGAKALYFLSERQIGMLDGADARAVCRIAESRAQKTQERYEKMCARGISFLSTEDAAYPKRLRNIPDPPFGLYVRGRLPREEQRTAAIVGARMCSEYGMATARKLGEQLAACGVSIVSGMARGVDAAGHTGALASGGGTCAVLGCGVDVCYPAENRQLYTDIIQNGCVLSEYHPGTQPLPAFFPQRNRIIAGLSDVVVVVEAKEKSGSLITADLALEQGRDIYAVPGRICEPLSAGCNNLIRQGAGIISSVEDFLKDLDLGGRREWEQESFEKLLLEKEERLVYSCVDLRPKSMEELLRRTGLGVPELSQALAGLVQKKFVAETFKNCYIRRI